jgi:phosphatidylglycerophosphate synthase
MKKENHPYAAFWQMRGMQSMWVTRNYSYRLGAFIAMFSSRLGLSPNILSLLSVVITCCSCAIGVCLGQGNWLAGLVVIAGLQLGYAFDCADGPLARVKGQESSFGSLLDKICDMSSGMLFPCILAYGAGHYYYRGVVEAEMDYTLRVLLVVIISRAILNVLLWLKELVLHKTNRLQEDQREHTLWWRIKRSAGLYIDEPVYRFGIGFAWALDWFWEFVIIYSLGIFVITTIYLWTSKKEMDLIDKASD